MNPQMTIPNDRAAFNAALAEIHHDHAAMRGLAEIAIRSGFPTDETLSLAEMVSSHERAEARLFALPFVAKPPENVIASAARAQRHCVEYLSGNYHLPDRSAAAALFVDTLLAHIASEEAWLAREDEHQKERLKTLA
jgi:hypothetical protein